ncbi:hypothetical protein [Peptostreptococcus porci]|nr:hypothetical protein [Peptostreptococcus porci]MDY2794201.1 hypothetical protein [Peptostreptococcus porci]
MRCLFFLLNLRGRDNDGKKNLGKKMPPSHDNDTDTENIKTNRL